ncbi:MAG TPA: efflux RND transporter permease subunit, partial [Thermoanaerobaculia bacterium]|nr:efflux RND transporter permease subunit [Thermoanaerobaculia bacterium]
VVVEAVARHREEGLSAVDAVAAALSDVGAPVIGTTLTTVVVFLPLAFLEGMVGRFFAALALTLSAAVLLSLFFALLVLPVLATRFLKKEPVRRERKKRSLAKQIRARYALLLRATLRHRVLTTLAAVLLLGLGAFALTRVAVGFLPEFDEGSFVLDYFLPAGTSLAETDEAATRIGRVLSETKGIATWSRRTGAELGPITATVFNRGDVTVLLAPRKKRPDFEEIVSDLRRRMAQEVPAARVEFIQMIEDVLSDLSGAPRPIEIRISGDDPDELEKKAGEIAARARKVPGLVDYYSGVEGRVPTLEVAPDRGALFRLGLTPKDVSDDLAVLMRGRAVGRVPWLDRLIDVRLRAPDEIRFSPARVRDLPVVGTNGEAAPLASVARVTEPPRPSVLFRENLRPVVLATADVEGRDLGSVAKDLSRELKGLAPPKGGDVEIGGRVASAHEAARDLSGVFLLGLLAVLAVLVAQFRAILPSLLILVTIPPALAGAFVTLWATRVPLNASSLVGLVLLTGLVVKNGILLVERAQPTAAAGAPPRVAALEAARRRARPIVMTTLCTVFGLFPLALGIGAAGEMQRPLALAVVGGLLVSTATTLLVLPALAAGRAIRPVS